MGRRWGALLIIASTWVLGACDELRFFIAELKEPVPTLAPAAVVGSGPTTAPEGMPLIGPSGLDEHGFPRASPDPRALLSMLRQEKYDELTRIVEACQSAFEADYHYEAWARAALGAFGFARDIDLPLLNRWIEIHGESFAPWAARGTYHVSRGELARGTKFARETSREQVNAMRAAHALGRLDLYRSLELNPRAIGAHRKLIHARRPHLAFAHAMTFCPNCDQIRETYLGSTTPRWGGSHENMRAVIEEAKGHPENPRLAALGGFIDSDICWSRADDEASKRQKKAACEASVVAGGNAGTLIQRGNQRYREERWQEAVADLSRAVELDVLATRARRQLALVKAIVGDVSAVGDIEMVTALLPDHPKRAEWTRGIVQNLLYNAGQAWGVRDLNAATRMFDAVLRIDPANAKAKKWAKTARKYGATSDTGGASEAGPSLEETKTRSAELAKVDDAAGALALWDAYNQAHATDGVGWFESARAAYATGDVEGAQVRAARACELRHEEGCLQAKQLKDGMGKPSRAAKKKKKRKSRRRKRR